VEKSAELDLDDGVCNCTHKRWGVDNEERCKTHGVMLLHERYAGFQYLHREAERSCASTIHHDSQARVIRGHQALHPILNLRDWEITTVLFILMLANFRAMKSMTESSLTGILS
jgi:hypothetical protein